MSFSHCLFWKSLKLCQNGVVYKNKIKCFVVWMGLFGKFSLFTVGSFIDIETVKIALFDYANVLWTTWTNVKSFVIQNEDLMFDLCALETFLYTFGVSEKLERNIKLWHLNSTAANVFIFKTVLLIYLTITIFYAYFLIIIVYLSVLLNFFL